MKLTVIDTPGFGDQINNENWYVSACELCPTEHREALDVVQAQPLESHLCPPHQGLCPPEGWERGLKEARGEVQRGAGRGGGGGSAEGILAEGWPGGRRGAGQTSKGTRGQIQAVLRRPQAAWPGLGG